MGSCCNSTLPDLLSDLPSAMRCLCSFSSTCIAVGSFASNNVHWACNKLVFDTHLEMHDILKILYFILSFSSLFHVSCRLPHFRSLNETQESSEVLASRRWKGRSRISMSRFPRQVCDRRQPPTYPEQWSHTNSRANIRALTTGVDMLFDNHKCISGMLRT